jgi:nucleoside-diphosphate-sugar epimerase
MEISIKDLAELIGSLVGYAGQVTWDTSRPNGQPRRMLDVSRAREYFDFKASTDFEAGLRKTIAWYRQHREAVPA